MGMVTTSSNSMASTSPVIIVTGASRGLGLAITSILLQRFSARVIAVSRSVTDGLTSLGKESEGRLELVQGDVTEESTAKRACEAATGKFGRLDGVVLNAGIAEPLCSIVDASVSDWQDIFNINVFSLLALLKHATPLLRPSSDRNEGGRVVFVSSGSATGNTAAWGAYNATKAAMNSLCRTYANEEKGIASFAVRPGMVDTDMQGVIRAQGPKSMQEAELARFVNAHQDGKLLKAEDPGYVLAALAVNGPLALSGQFLSWDGKELEAFRRPA